MSRHHLKVVTEAAKRHIAVNPHEPIKDTGLRRTYPNWVAREGARGMEYNAWGNPPNPPEHEANLVFKRMCWPWPSRPRLSLTRPRRQPIQSTIASISRLRGHYSPSRWSPTSGNTPGTGPSGSSRRATDWADTRVLNATSGLRTRAHGSRQDDGSRHLTGERTRTAARHARFPRSRRSYPLRATGTATADGKPTPCDRDRTGREAWYVWELALAPAAARHPLRRPTPAQCRSP